MTQRDKAVVTLEVVACNERTGEVTLQTQSTALETWAGGSSIEVEQKLPGKVGWHKVDRGRSKTFTYHGGSRRRSGRGRRINVTVNTAHRKPDATALKFTVDPAYPRTPELILTPSQFCGPAKGSRLGYYRFLPWFMWPRWLRRREGRR